MHKELDTKVFIEIGKYENVSELQHFLNEMKTKKNKNLELQTKVISGMVHLILSNIFDFFDRCRLNDLVTQKQS
jgi:hypothetical protein